MKLFAYKKYFILLFCTVEAKKCPTGWSAVACRVQLRVVDFAVLEAADIAAGIVGRVAESLIGR